MLKAVIDRFEEDKAVLLLGEDEATKVNFPRKYLDQSLKEGDYVTIEIKYDEKATEEAKAEVAKLMQELKRKHNID